MRTLILIAAILSIAACVTAKPVSLPNGTQGYAIRCPGHARDISDCMNEAASVCGGAYQIVDRETGEGLGVVQPLGNGAIYGRSVHRMMVVSCGPSR